MATKLIPSPQFMRRVINPQAKRELQRLLKEVETYQYIHSQPVLTAFTDENWIELVKRSTIGERVTYLRYVAMRQARALLDEQKRKQKEEDEKTRLENIGAKFEAGEMAYGPGGYELVKDPRESRKRMRQVEGARICSSMRTDLPGIVVDLQGFTAQQPRPYSLMMRQIQYMMMANFETRPAMPLSFYGLHPDDSKANDVRQKLFGYYEAEFVNQMVLPDLHMEPASALKQNRKKVVYINNKATRMLDGPLDADFYVFAAVRDHGQTGFSSARSNGIPVYRLPIHRYVDWKSGHQALPINNIVRILREVFHSGGDWRSAFLNNLSYKNLTSMAERLEKNPVAVKEFQENTRQLQEAVQLITEATRDM